MKVLNLVPVLRPFYIKQEFILKELGIKSTTVTVPGAVPRTALNYVLFYPKIISKSFTHYDLVHANFGLMAPFALLQPHRPLVLTLWGSSDEDFFYENHPWTWLGKNFVRLELFNEIIVRNEKMKKILKERVGLNSSVIPHGVDLMQFCPIDKQKAKEMVGWSLDDKHILFPYDISRDVKNYPLAKIVIEEVKQRIDEKVKLEIFHKIPHNKFPLYMNAADILLLTSKSEGSPNCVKEALACNVPVVSTDVGDVKFLLEGVKYSKVCKNKGELIEAIIYLLKENIQSNGRERIIELGLSLEETGKKIMDVYKRALIR